MDPHDRAHYEKLLLQERARLEGTITSVRDELGLGLDGDDRTGAVGDLTDRATEAAARDEESAVVARESAALTDLDRTLRVLYAEPDKYGVCTVCGETINRARLDILPATRYCTKHAA